MPIGWRATIANPAQRLLSTMNPATSPSSSNDTSAQQASIAKLERAGYVFTCWFDAHDGNDGQCATMTLRKSRISHLQAEVDPDGTVNGVSVDAYLAQASNRR